MNFLIDIKTWFASIPKDKKLHLAAGVGVAVVAGLLGFGPTVAIGASALAGVAKEVYDWKHPENHTVDHRDAVATAGGGAVGALGTFLYSLFA